MAPDPEPNRPWADPDLAPHAAARRRGTRIFGMIGLLGCPLGIRSRAVAVAGRAGSTRRVGQVEVRPGSAVAPLGEILGTKHL